MREKLIKLLYQAPCESDLEGRPGSCPYRKYGRCGEVDRLDYCAVQRLADHLIAHGVTVQEWISVKDRLPDRNDMVIAFYPTMRGTSGEMQIHKAWAMSDTCTHWMPLPPAPKGE